MNIAFDDKTRKLAITDVDVESVEKAPMSKSGKAKLLYSSGGFKKIGNGMLLSIMIIPDKKG